MRVYKRNIKGYINYIYKIIFYFFVTFLHKFLHKFYNISSKEVQIDFPLFFKIDTLSSQPSIIWSFQTIIPHGNSQRNKYKEGTENK